MFWKIYFVRVFLSLTVCAVIITALSFIRHVPNLMFTNFNVCISLLLTILVGNLITTYFYCKQKIGK